jgi:hypothetical protein
VLNLDGNVLGPSGTAALARCACGCVDVYDCVSVSMRITCVSIDPRQSKHMQQDPTAVQPRSQPTQSNYRSTNTNEHATRAFRAGACQSLRELHLRNNDVRGEGLRELLGAFSAGACPELSTFNLDSNMMGASGALFLARALRDGACQNLQVRVVLY